MEILRTPDARFDGLPGWSFEPRYVDVDGLRIHYVDEGPPEAAPVLLLHGEPTWAYLYRTMIAGLTAAGHRCVALDFVGFGRSDKPSEPTAYTYQAHVDWTRGAIEALDLRGITLFGQDWGGLVGLRIAAENEERFARIVASNTFLPTGDTKPPEIWFMFRDMTQTVEVFDIGRTVQAGCRQPVADEVRAAYDAPFPEEHFKAGARAFPTIVPVTSDDPASEPNRAAWKVLEAWDKPFLTLFGADDPITRGAERVFQTRVPGAAGQPHEVVPDAGHFIQEDRGDLIAGRIASWLG